MCTIGAFLACEQKKHVLAPALPETIRDIPIYQFGTRAGSHVDAYLITNLKGNQLRLDNIKSGYDSLQIRFWVSPAPDKKKYVVILDRSYGRWSGKVICYISGTYIVNRDIVPRTWDSIKICYTRKVEPVSGWPVFLKRLDSLQLFTMKHSLDLQGYSEGKFDSSSFYIEYARFKYYRFYSYDSPQRFVGKHISAEKILLIWNVMKKELNIEV